LYYPLGWLYSNDVLVRDAFYQVFWIAIAMQPICGVAFVFDGMFKGLGHMSYLRNVLIFCTSLGFIPVLLIADYFNTKLYGVWAAFFVWIVLRALALIFKFNRLYVKRTVIT
jgi:Na+-driven multidrug efflux pump